MHGTNMKIIMWVGEGIETHILSLTCQAMRRTVRRILHISAILTLTDVVAETTFKCNYETTDNEPRTIESAGFSFTKSVPYLLSNSQREMLAFD